LLLLLLLLLLLPPLTAAAVDIVVACRSVPQWQGTGCLATGCCVSVEPV
jgi:hypothetical protein